MSGPPSGTRRTAATSVNSSHKCAVATSKILRFWHILLLAYGFCGQRHTVTVRSVLAFHVTAWKRLRKHICHLSKESCFVFILLIERFTMGVLRQRDGMFLVGNSLDSLILAVLS